MTRYVAYFAVSMHHRFLVSIYQFHSDNMISQFTAQYINAPNAYRTCDLKFVFLPSQWRWQEILPGFSTYQPTKQLSNHMSNKIARTTPARTQEQ